MGDNAWIFRKDTLPNSVLKRIPGLYMRKGIPRNLQFLTAAYTHNFFRRTNSRRNASNELIGYSLKRVKHPMILTDKDIPLFLTDHPILKTYISERLKTL
jgi:hypothetical protein